MTRARPKRPGRRERGGALYYVLVLATVLAALGARWQDSQRNLQARSAPSLARAEARAIRDAAWTRARAALARGAAAAHDWEPLLGGQARVVVVRTGADRRVLVEGRVASPLAGRSQPDPRGNVLLSRRRLLLRGRGPDLRLVEWGEQ